MVRNQPSPETTRTAAVEESDAQLLLGYTAKHDEDAFAELVRRYERLVWRTARAGLGSGPDAEDVFQATFVALARSAGSIRRPDALAGWLHQTALRLGHRARRRRSRKIDPAARSGPADPLDLLTARELLAAVDAGIAALPEKYRLPVLLCGVEELTMDAAAARLGWKVGVVRGRLERGRLRLRGWLGARGLTVPVVLGGTVASPPKLSAAAAQGGVMSPAVAELVAAEGRVGLGLLNSAFTRLSTAAAVLSAGVVIAAGYSPKGDRRDPSPENVEPLPPPPLWSTAQVAGRSTSGGGSPSSPNVAACWTPDGKRVIIVAPEGNVESDGSCRVRAVDATDGKPHDGSHVGERIDGTIPDGKPLAVSPDGRSIALAMWTRKSLNRGLSVTLIGVTGTTRLRPTQSMSQGFWPIVSFNPQGDRVYCATGFRCDVSCWDAASGELVHDMNDIAKTRNMLVNAAGAAFHPEGRWMAVAQNNRTVVCIDTYSGLFIESLAWPSVPNPVRVLTLACSADGKTMVGTGGATVAGMLTVGVWPVQPASSHGRLMAAPSVVTVRVPTTPTNSNGMFASDISVTSDGRTVALACNDGVVRLVDLHRRSLVGAGMAASGPLTTASFSPDGRRVLTVGGGTVSVWAVDDLMASKPRQLPPADGDYPPRTALGAIW